MLDACNRAGVKMSKLAAQLTKRKPLTLAAAATASSLTLFSDLQFLFSGKLNSLTTCAKGGTCVTHNININNINYNNIYQHTFHTEFLNLSRSFHAQQCETSDDFFGSK